MRIGTVILDERNMAMSERQLIDVAKDHVWDLVRDAFVEGSHVQVSIHGKALVGGTADVTLQAVCDLIKSEGGK